MAPANRPMTRLEARLRSAERALFAHCGVEPSEHLVHAGSAADAPRLRVLAEEARTRLGERDSPLRAAVLAQLATGMAPRKFHHAH